MLSQVLTSNSLSPSRSQKRKKDQKTYFNDVISEAGIVVNNKTPIVITQEQSLVVRDVNKILRSHITFPNNLQDFMLGVKSYCKNEQDLRKAILPTELRKKNELLTQKIQQDSLMRILLSVNCLQNEVTEMLLEQVTVSVPEENNDTSWLRLLLSPLRYLSYVNDSKTLATKLLDILEIGTYPAQIEILNLIPEIVTDNEYEETAKALSKLLEQNPDLTGAIIECLNSLNLSLNTRNEIHQQILAKIESTASSKIFPILFEFLITDCNAKNIQAVLLSCRNVLDKIMEAESNDKEVKANKVLIFNRLEAFATARKSLCEGWISVISNIRVHTDQKPIDIMILFMLHSVGTVRKSTIEGIFRKKIKGNDLKISLIEQLFKKYYVSQILKDQLNSIIEIAANLLRFSADSILIEFGKTAFKLLFNHELTDRLQRQDIIYNLLMLSGMSDKKNIVPILNVFKALSDDFEKLQQHTVQLMGLLEKLDSIEVRDAKIVFELLCSLTCGEMAGESMSGFRDEIHMLIRKQLSSAKKIVKHRGIIGAVVMAQYLAVTSEEQLDVEVADNSMTIDDLPQGPAHDAVSLLMLANTCTLGSADSIGLYYDQLAGMLAADLNFDNHFVAWLSSHVTNDFQNTFITETVSRPINDIEMLMKYSLNTDEEVDVPIAVKVAELCLRPQSDKRSVLILPPLFRLLRLVQYRLYNKDLANIDALLGCAVVMPNLENLDNYELDQLQQVSECVFHCINWFREIISAFVTQKNRKLRQKVLERLTDLVHLEEILDKCLENVPEYKLPLSYFDTTSQSSKQLSPARNIKPSRPRKKQKVNDTTANSDEIIASAAAAPQSKLVKKKKEITRDVCFRDIDTDVLLLLRYPLKINQDININTSTQISQASQVTTLSIHQLKFLLKDIVQKLETVLYAKKNVSSHIQTVNVNSFITDCIKLLSYIKKHFDCVTLYLSDLLKKADGCIDSPQMFTSEANVYKTTFALILQTYALIFGWSGFQHLNNKNLLRDCLKNLRNESQSQVISIKGLSLEFMAKLLEHIDLCLSLPAAISLIQIMQTLYVVTPHADLKKRIAVAAGKLLTKKWYDLRGEYEVGKNYSIKIDILIKAYLKGINVKTACGLVGTLQEQASQLKTKEDCLPMLISINKLNFYLLYRCLCASLLEAVRTEIASLTNNQHLALWRTTALTMQGLMSVVKIQETRTNLISFLRSSVGILKIFLANGIPVLEIMLRSKTDEVIEIFKILQTSTRFLHHLCCYSKFTKDASLVTYVPQFRLLLESLLYRVKAALVANNCSAAFWMGVLKNKNLHGEDILSQSSIRTDSTEVESDNEELPADETDDEREDTVQDVSEGESEASRDY